MIKSCLTFCCASMVILALQLPSQGQETKSTADVAIPANAIGKQCVIRLNNQPKKTSAEYAGRISSVNENSVVLSSVTKTVRTEQSPPLLKGIPYLSRLFKNVGIGKVEIAGDQKILRSKIASIKIMEQLPKRIRR